MLLQSVQAAAQNRGGDKYLGHRFPFSVCIVTKTSRELRRRTVITQGFNAIMLVGYAITPAPALVPMPTEAPSAFRVSA